MTGSLKHLTLTADEVALLLAEDWRRDIELFEMSHVRTLETVDSAPDGTAIKATDKIG